MVKWKSLTVKNLERAQCIYLSKGFDYKGIKSRSYLEKAHGEDWIKSSAIEAVKAIKNDEREYEIIFEVFGTYRCRMYIYPASDSITKERFPGAKFSIGVTHMTHIIHGQEKEVEERFSRIEKALLDERFPAIKF